MFDFRWWIADIWLGGAHANPGHRGAICYRQDMIADIFVVPIIYFPKPSLIWKIECILSNILQGTSDGEVIICISDNFNVTGMGEMAAVSFPSYAGGGIELW